MSGPEMPSPPDQGGQANTTDDLGNATTQDQGTSAAAEKQAPPLCPRCKVPVTVHADGSMICEKCFTSWDSLEDLQGRQRRPRRHQILPIQEFLKSLLDQLPGIRMLNPGSLFAERLAARQLSGEEIARAHVIYYGDAALEYIDPVVTWEKMDDLVRGIPPYEGSQDAAVKEAERILASLPKIDAGEKRLAIVTEQAWAAMIGANEPARFFSFGGLPSRLEAREQKTAGNRQVKNPHPIAIVSLSPDRVRYELARVAEWFTKEKHGDHPAMPPMSIVKDLLASPGIRFPILDRVVSAPLFSKDGKLRASSGYFPEARVYLQLDASVEGIAVPEIPTKEQIVDALVLIRDDLLGDFSFADEADRAAAIAKELQPFVREKIDGPTPIYGIDAPIQGSGKGLLERATSFPALAREPTSITEGRDDDEWRKRITAALSGGAEEIVIDNLTRPLDCGALASAITSEVWTDRILGKSEMLSVPACCTWAYTANNPTLSGELRRRTVRIRIRPDTDQPWLRQGFRHPDLMSWAREHRRELVQASLTLIQAWIAAGEPAGKITPLGSFESWTKVMGGILETAGIKGFLGNLADLYLQTDTESETWRDFVGAWWPLQGIRSDVARIKGKPFDGLSTADLSSLESGFDLGKGNEKSQRIVLGKMLSSQRDRIYEIPKDDDKREEEEEQGMRKVKITFVGTKKRAARWKLEELLTRDEGKKGECVNVSECSGPSSENNQILYKEKNPHQYSHIPLPDIPADLSTLPLEALIRLENMLADYMNSPPGHPELQPDLDRVDAAIVSKQGALP